MISIITDIGLDHMDILGKTVEEIAKKKAGIIKKDQDTIMYFKEKVTDIIKAKCKNENNKLHLIENIDITNYSFNEDYQKIDFGEHKNIEINLKGKCQIYNAAIALECIDVLRKKGYKIEESAVRQGLKTVIHKARFEQLKDNPKIIFDGGHNEDAINNLVKTINQYYSDKRKIFILSILKRKDYKKVIEILSKEKNSIFIFTSGNNEEEYVSKEELYLEAENYLKGKIYKESLQHAIKIAKQEFKTDVIFVIR